MSEITDLVHERQIGMLCQWAQSVKASATNSVSRGEPATDLIVDMAGMLVQLVEEVADLRRDLARERIARIQDMVDERAQQSLRESITERQRRDA